MLIRAEDQFKSGYHHELDMSPVLGPDEMYYYQSLIGVMRWMIEIGHKRYEYQDVSIIITLSNDKTGAFGGGPTYYGLPEAQV